ncbi:hypothetical protein [Burkholderia pseudomallei]|uniref:hypothetical protein n=1 Tax=Burkholderia pseudomallei TaxID=28450 RepID=UPI000F0842B2|nr:hypothetical protein [Burkholderia pseudomallei]VBD52258.1 Uncharacterised protein [Burkholderia pseudomallei]VBE82925.1 Uncharacterised protein [Burkholderia pseudomallei]
MAVNGFESCPDEHFSDPEEWDALEKMTGCQQAAHKARLCYAAMIAAAPQPTTQADARVGLTDEQIDDFARPFWLSPNPGDYFNYHGFARTLLQGANHAE